MAQQRFYNFGAPLTAETALNVHASLAAPCLLSGGETTILGSDTFSVAPHSVIFENGIILKETEVKTFTLDTLEGAKNLSLVYEHVDVQLVGGAAATLTLEEGLLESSGDKVVIAWVIYPGGGVPLSFEMIFSPERGQLRPQRRFSWNAQTAYGEDLLPLMVDATSSDPAPWQDITVPSSSPYQVTLDPSDVLLANGPPTLSEPNGKVRVTDKDTGDVLTETTGSPAAGEFVIDYDAREIVFNVADSGKELVAVDLTYGTRGVLLANPTASQSINDFTATFSAHHVPKQVAVFAATVRGNDPVITVESVTDTSLGESSISSLNTETSDSIHLVRNRILSGSFLSGEPYQVVVRVKIPANSSCYLMSVTTSPYDEPFSLIDD